MTGIIGCICYLQTAGLDTRAAGQPRKVNGLRGRKGRTACLTALTGGRSGWEAALLAGVSTKRAFPTRGGLDTAYQT